MAITSKHWLRVLAAPKAEPGRKGNLTPQIVHEIRQRAGSASLRALGDEYNLSHTMISNIIHGRVKAYKNWD